MVGFFLIQEAQPSTSHAEGTERAANRSDQEAATVDQQSLAGHEGLSH